jgi:lysophospholipase L1-like esterase
MTGVRMPSNSELGPLNATAIRPQPMLPRAIVTGFAPGSSTHPRRIAFWGDSHLAGGPLAATLMNSLRDSGYTVGARFLPPSMGRANVNLAGLRAYCIGSAWTTKVAYTGSSAIDTGPALLTRLVDAGRDSYLWLDLRNAARQADVSHVELVYRAPAGATVSYVLDDGKPANSRLPPTTASQSLTLGARAPLSTLKLTVSSGKLALLGIVLDRAKEPDVILDVFGVPSATVKGWANTDPAALAQSLRGVTYDAVVLEYGTNEGADADFDVNSYARTLDEALRHLRQVFPKASCVLMGPPDRGVLKTPQGKLPPLLAYSYVHRQIETTQREVGVRYGCAAWSWQGLMGGPGGSYGWANARPGLMGRDLIHLSPDGYRLTGRSLAHSLGWTP